jgi:hypothetical protein
MEKLLSIEGSIVPPSVKMLCLTKQAEANMAEAEAKKETSKAKLMKVGTIAAIVAVLAFVAFLIVKIVKK